MTRGQHWALFGAVALSVLALVIARRTAAAVGARAGLPGKPKATVM